MNPTYETIEVESADGAAWVWLNRPERRNIIDATVADELFDALSRLAGDDDVRVVVLSGRGTMFSPGADLRRDPTQPARLPQHESFQAGRLLVEMPAVTIAAINGACAGAGLAYASACDLRLASAAARMAVGFVEIGVSGELGFGWTLTRSLGRTRARELMLLPRKFTAQEALEMGFVSRVYEPAAFDASVAELVSEMAERNPVALRDIKANLVDAETLPLVDYIERETERHVSRFSGDAAPDTLARLIDRGRAISGN